MLQSSHVSELISFLGCSKSFWVKVNFRVQFKLIFQIVFSLQGGGYSPLADRQINNLITGVNFLHRKFFCLIS